MKNTCCCKYFAKLSFSSTSFCISCAASLVASDWWLASSSLSWSENEKVISNSSITVGVLSFACKNYSKQVSEVIPRLFRNSVIVSSYSCCISVHWSLWFSSCSFWQNTCHSFSSSIPFQTFTYHTQKLCTIRTNTVWLSNKTPGILHYLPKTPKSKYSDSSLSYNQPSAYKWRKCRIKYSLVNILKTRSEFSPFTDKKSPPKLYMIVEAVP